MAPKPIISHKHVGGTRVDNRVVVLIAIDPARATALLGRTDHQCIAAEINIITEQVARITKDIAAIGIRCLDISLLNPLAVLSNVNVNGTRLGG